MLQRDDYQPNCFVLRHFSLQSIVAARRQGILVVCHLVPYPSSLGFVPRPFLPPEQGFGLFTFDPLRRLSAAAECNRDDFFAEPCEFFRDARLEMVTKAGVLPP